MKNNKKYIISLDQGTTTSRAIIYDTNGNIIDKKQIYLTQSFPKKGWVEHDAIEIWNSQLSSLQQAVNSSNIRLDQIIGVGICNQRETIVAWNSETSMPIYSAIVWQDNRTKDYCDELKVHTDMIYKKTGLIISPYFSATKIRWILDNVPNARELAKENKLKIGTIDSWLVYKFSKNTTFVTDYTNASRTMLFNINTMQWDDELLELFDIPKNILPEIRSSAENYCDIYHEYFSSNNKDLKIPILAISGDQQASLFGQKCWDKGDINITLGTGAFILGNLGNEKILSKEKLLTSIACNIKDEKINYIMEGSIFNCGNVIQWLINDLKILYKDSESEWYANLVIDDNVFFVPSLHGLSAPYWKDNFSGAIFGINRKTKRENIIKASLDGIAYQIKDVVDIIKKEINLSKDRFVNVGGGVSNNKYLIQFLSNMLQSNISLPVSKETSALGIFYLIGISNNVWTVENLIPDFPAPDQIKPEISKIDMNKKYKKWKSAVNMCIKWNDDTNNQN